jgi:hypothetical protein
MTPPSWQAVSNISFVHALSLPMVTPIANPQSAQVPMTLPSNCGIFGAYTVVQSCLARVFTPGVDLSGLRIVNRYKL